MGVEKIIKESSITPGFRRGIGDLIYVGGDVSATNVTLAAVRVDSRGVERIATCKYDGQRMKDGTNTDFDSVYAHFLGRLRLKQGDVDRAVLAPAGPTDGKTCKMTNARFSVRAPENGIVINDFRAQAFRVAAHLDHKVELKSIALLHVYTRIGGQVVYTPEKGGYGVIEWKKPVRIKGPGTGYGSGGLFYGDMYFPEDSEGGHTLLPVNPRNRQEAEMIRWIMDKQGLGRDSLPHFELVVSGNGLNDVLEYQKERMNKKDKATFSSEFQALDKLKTIDARSAFIAQTAKAHRKQGMINSPFLRTIDYEYEVVGRSLYDAAVDYKAEGGLWISGGWIRKDLFTDKVMEHDVVRQIMKGYYSGPSHRGMLDNIQIRAVLDPNAGLDGALQVALQNPYWEHETARISA